MSDTPDRFQTHPAPDRVYQRIEPAEIEMGVLDVDDVTMRSQVVPGGGFAVEIITAYDYAGRECSQNVTLDRAAAESLRDRLDDALETDDRK